MFVRDTEGPRILAPGLAGPISPVLRSPQQPSAGQPIFLSSHGGLHRYGLAAAPGHQPAVSQATANQLASMNAANSAAGLMSMNMNAAAAAAAAGMNGAPPPLMSPTEAGLLYGHYATADPYAAALAANSMFELPGGIDPSAAGTSAYVR